MATDVQERLYRLVVDGTQATAALNKIAKNTEGMEQRFQRMAGAFHTIMGAFAAGSALRGIADAAQRLNALEATLSTLRGGAEEGAEALELVYDVAKNTGAALDSTGQAFTRMSIGLQALGASNQQIADMTENFIKLGRVGGSSMEEVNGALLQFGQALSSGVLQGDEFKSISEQMPLLMDKLAKSLNVTRGQLKQMGSDGKLTADVIANVLLGSTEELNEAFAKLPETFDQGMNRINAALAKLSREWFNQTEAGNAIVKILNIIADEIDSITSESSEWTGVVDDISASFKQLGNFVIDTIREIKTMGAALTLVADATKAISEGSWEGVKAAKDTFDQTTTSINNTAAAQKRYLEGTQNDLDLLAKSVDNYHTTTEKLKPPPVITDTGKAAKEAAKDLKQLESAWESMFKKVQSPDEIFAEQSRQLDDIVAKLNPAAEAVARVREELIKVRDEANAALAIENLTAYEQGFIDIAEEIGKTANEAEMLRAKLDYMNQIRNVAELQDQYLALAESLGESASAADQVAVAVAKVNEEGKKVEELRKAFEDLQQSGKYSEEQLAKIKEALGGLGETSKEITSISVAIGQTLANSISGFVDTLLSSEQDINQWFANLLMQIGKLIIQMTILNSLKAQAGKGGILGMIGDIVAGSAKGNMFPAGMSLPQGVYHQPQIFKFAKGAAFNRTGVLAESGPEAVVPLKRTSGGELGVQASPVNVSIYNYTETEVSVTETNKEDGTKQLDIMIERKIKAAMSDGSLDRSFRDNYNLSRTGR